MDAVVKGVEILQEILRKNDSNATSVEQTKDPVLLWLNADICKGPLDSQQPLIDADRFLEYCHPFASSGDPFIG